MIKEFEMPPLPEENLGLPHWINAYTASQMHAYAQAYAAHQIVELKAKLAATEKRCAELTHSEITARLPDSLFIQMTQNNKQVSHAILNNEIYTRKIDVVARVCALMYEELRQ